MTSHVRSTLWTLSHWACYADLLKAIIASSSVSLVHFFEILNNLNAFNCGYSIVQCASFEVV